MRAPVSCAQESLVSDVTEPARDPESILAEAAALTARTSDLDAALAGLLQLAVDAAGATDAVVFLQDPDRVRRYAGADRREGVERLAHIPLHVPHLHVARGDVVDDRVTPHVIHRAARRNVRALATDHDRERWATACEREERATTRRQR